MYNYAALINVKARLCHCLHNDSSLHNDCECKVTYVEYDEVMPCIYTIFCRIKGNGYTIKRYNEQVGRYFMIPHQRDKKNPRAGRRQVIQF
jgi:hypothetical protein